MSIITNIDFDHTQLLGDTLDKIACEKAGIIKHNIPVVIGESNPITDTVFLDKAKTENAPICFADQQFSPIILNQENPFLLKLSINEIILNSPLAGEYQAKNLNTVYTAIEMLNKYQLFEISTEVIQNGVSKVIENTQLLGRWQKINELPLAIADTGHNPHGLRYVLGQLEKLNVAHLHFVLGMVNDKDIQTVLSMLPKTATYYFCKANIPRGLEAQLLKKEAEQFDLIGNSYLSVSEAYKQALLNATEKDVVFVGGSTFTVAEVV
jgi:dihydrofolate synthase/folylpolyglutamate synthase